MYIHTYTHTQNALEDLTYQDRPYFHNLKNFEDLCLEASIKDLRHVTESHESRECQHLELYPYVLYNVPLTCRAPSSYANLPKLSGAFLGRLVYMNAPNEMPM